MIGIANGPENLIFLYEKEVQERAVQNGTITKEKIRKNAKLFKVYGMGIAIAFTLIAVYGVNGARGFAEGFWQILVIWLVAGVFDRFFIDWYWVNHTKAWIIEGTEDLRPYIPRKAVVVAVYHSGVSAYGCHFIRSDAAVCQIEKSKAISFAFEGNHFVEDQCRERFYLPGAFFRLPGLLPKRPSA